MLLLFSESKFMFLQEKYVGHLGGGVTKSLCFEGNVCLKFKTESTFLLFKYA